MRSRTRVRPLDVVRVGLIALALSGIGLLAFRSAVIEAYPANAAAVTAVAASDQSGLLERLTDRIVASRTRPPPAAYAPVAAAANALPLDERPFLLFALRDLANGQDRTGVRLLEEARHRNPRQRVVRLILLDRYLRADRIGDAVGEMTVLTRLLPAAGNVLADAIAKLASDPATAPQARAALDNDPVLLNQVLVTMANNHVGAAVVRRFGGAAAPGGLEASGWRTALIRGIIDQGDFAGARAFWRESYRIDPALLSAGLYDADLRGAVGAPPFNWSLTSSEVGAAEIHQGALQVEYYGRRPGPLASQLMVLAPGRYRLSYVITGEGGGGDGGGLTWSVACHATPDKPIITGQVIPLRQSAQAAVVDFDVPATGCPAQFVTLDAVPGGYAGSTSARITKLRLSARS